MGVTLPVPATKRFPVPEVSLWLAAGVLLFLSYNPYSHAPGLDRQEILAAALAGQPALGLKPSAQIYPDIAPFTPQRFPQDLLFHGEPIGGDRRLGPSLLAAPFYRLYGLFGFRLLFVVSRLVLAMGVALLAGRLGAEKWLGMGAGLLAVGNAHALFANDLNPAYLSATVAILLLATLASGLERERTVVAGALGGALLCMENFFLPVFVLLIAWVAIPPLPSGEGWGEGKTKRSLLPMLAAALVVRVPVVVWHLYAFGSLWADETQAGAPPGAGFIHHLGPFPFRFNGMLQWPFAPHLVHTPGYSFPVFLWLSLSAGQFLGLAACAAAVLGGYAVCKRDRKNALLVVGWIVVWYAFLGVQENWAYLKETYLAWFLPEVAVLAAVGLGTLGKPWQDWRRWSSFALLVVLLAGGVLLTSQIRVPADTRFFQRFPQFFQKPGARERIQALETSERTRLTSPRLLPSAYALPPFEENTSLMRLHRWGWQEQPLGRIPGEAFRWELLWPRMEIRGPSQ